MQFVEPAEFDIIVPAQHGAGAQFHIHAKSGQATEAAVDSIARALVVHPRAERRHVSHRPIVDAAPGRAWVPGVERVARPA